MKKIIFCLINFYQKYISPLYPPACRYIPSCSNYAKEAVETHGSIKGSYLAIKRILRCNPLGGMGFDPVPSKKSKK